VGCTARFKVSIQRPAKPLLSRAAYLCHIRNISLFLCAHFAAFAYLNRAGCRTITDAGAPSSAASTHRLAGWLRYCLKHMVGTSS